MADFNLFKVEQWKTVFKGWGRRDAATNYERMYNTADQLSSHETRRYLIEKRNERFLGRKSARQVMEEAQAYKRERLGFHLDKMLKLHEQQSREEERAASKEMQDK